MAKDILTDSVTGELLIKDGDFVIGDSDEQNLEDLIEFTKGMVKQQPLSGVGVITMLKQRVSEGEIISETRSQMRADAWNIEDVYLDAGELNAIGSRNDN